MDTTKPTALPIAGSNPLVDLFRRLKIDTQVVRNFDDLSREELDNLRQQYVAAGGDDDEFTELLAMMRDE